ncbi:unnamed protein product [Leptidea sinapis]|uniref:Major facilitator superfamily associated domain-containing protein n=1 Tax=Leptidea sinapis TaxID=189913 RepID=A0A5E4PVG8_9NEOP|nr:unnamed protein product [Leptidea sinapis]
MKVKMKRIVNKNLITLKCVLFCFLAGIGCIYPFLPLHMLSVGLNKGEARLISTVTPCVALLGPAILGPLIDKLSVGRGSTGGAGVPSGSGKLLRIVTALCLILSALFYSLLLAARRPQVLFMCDADRGYVMQEVCAEGMRCNRWEGEKSGVLAVGACEYGCADENMTWVMTPFTTTSTTTTVRPLYNSVANATPAPAVEEVEDDTYFEMSPPHLCYNGQCVVYMQHADRLRCAVPPERLKEFSQDVEDCKPAVRCQVLDPYDEPGGVLADAECRRVLRSRYWALLA